MVKQISIAIFRDKIKVFPCQKMFVVLRLKVPNEPYAADFDRFRTFGSCLEDIM